MLFTPFNYSVKRRLVAVLLTLCLCAGVHRSLRGVGGGCGLHHKLALQSAVHRSGGARSDVRTHGESVYLFIWLNIVQLCRVYRLILKKGCR